MAIIATAFDEAEARVRPHLEAIRAILEADLFEDQMGLALRNYCKENLTDMDLGAEVYDRLASDKIISKPKFRELWNK